MKLYEISGTLLNIENDIYAKIEEGEEDGDTTTRLFEALDEWTEDFSSKVANIGGLVASMLAEAEAVKEVNKRRAQYAKQLENRAESLSRYCISMMQTVQKKEVSRADILVRVKPGLGSVTITDTEAVPVAYQTLIPETFAINKAKIRKDLLDARKAGNEFSIPGAMLEFVPKLEIK